MEMVREGTETFEFEEVLTLEALSEPDGGISQWGGNIIYEKGEFSTSEFQRILDTEIIYSASPSSSPATEELPKPDLWSLHVFPNMEDFVFRFNHAVSDQGTFLSSVARPFARSISRGEAGARTVSEMNPPVERLFYG